MRNKSLIGLLYDCEIVQTYLQNMYSGEDDDAIASNAFERIYDFLNELHEEDCKIVQDHISEEILSSDDLVAYNCFKKIKEWLESECKIQEINKEINEYVKKWNEGK